MGSAVPAGVGGTSAAPPDFGTRLRAASLAAQTDGGPDELIALAQGEHGLVETVQIDRALRKLSAEARSGLRATRLALLGSMTLDHLVPAIRVAGLARRLWIETYTCGYGQYRQELLDARSPLAEFAPNVITVSLGVSDVVQAVALSASAAEVESAVEEAAVNVEALWAAARNQFAATVVQQSFLDVSEPVFGSFDRLVPAAPARLTSRLNDRLAEAAARSGVLWLDVAGAAARDGLDAWFDVGQWLQAKMQIAMAAAPRFGDLLARVVAARLGLARKCLVLDLDNTLWGGVVGDDGADGIVLGQGSAAGEAHLALQRYAKQLKERGVMLAVCSKNDPAIVDEVFRTHPEMVLRSDDIAAFAVNWTDKVTNLEAIAESLNIGVDSLVFVDDNPAERAHVRARLPMVAVPELPDDPAGFVRCLARGGHFETASFTDEDRHRAADYAANAARRRLQRAATSVDDFLRDLGMTVAFGPVRAVDLERAAQLLNKTNQFNTTGRRYSVDELRAFCAVPNHIALQFRLADRFGDSGLVSVMLLRPADGRPQALDVDSWVMSCRVFGRRLEHEAMNAAVDAARRAGASELFADFRPTARNGVIGRLFDDLGFSPSDSPDPAVQRWRLSISRYVRHQTPMAAVAPVAEPVNV
jgi:FkbH-like protein